MRGLHFGSPVLQTSPPPTGLVFSFVRVFIPFAARAGDYSDISELGAMLQICCVRQSTFDKVDYLSDRRLGPEYEISFLFRLTTQWHGRVI